MKKALIALILLAAIVGGAYWYLSGRQSSDTAADTPASETMDRQPAAEGRFTQQRFENVKSAHYVSSNPANNALLSSAVSMVSIKFNFDLASPSRIKVTLGGADVTSGSTKISADKLTLSIPVTASKTGNYKVEYTACWPDRSCHDGSFGFSVKL